MSDVETIEAKYCPECGLPVVRAEAFPSSGDLTVTGVFEREGAHVIVEPGQVRLFEHGDSDGESP